jgi:hypothetical protein
MPHSRRRSTAAALCLGLAITLVSCGGSTTPTAATTRSLRSVSPVDLLNRVALDGDVCVLLPPVEEEEGKLPGTSARAGQTFYARVNGSNNGSNVHVAIDRFSNGARARAAATTAAPGIATMLGDGTKQGAPLPRWPGSVTFTRRVVDYTGQPRDAFGAVVVAGHDVVRINSLGLPQITSTAQFRALATRLLDGFTGSTGVRTIPSCT